MAQVTSKDGLRYSCIAIYSSKLGFEEPRIQKERLRAFANTMGLKIDEYIDSKKYDSATVDEISEDLSKVKQPLVLTWRLDCLPASMKGLEDVFKLISFLANKHVSFVSIEDKIDTDSDVGSFSIAINRAWREYKKNRKVTNARASTIKARSKNVKIKTGRKKQRDDARIHSLRASGLSIREIASRIGFSTTAVQRSLKTFEQTPSTEPSPQGQSPDL